MKASRTVSCLLFIALFVFLTGFSPADQKIKATWLWQTTMIASEPDHILSFAQEQGVNLLYLKIDITRKPAYYQPFIKKAHAAGVTVHALGGNPNWGLKENRSKILDLVDWVNAYNQQVSPDEKIKGIHLDIEPYLLPEWKQDQASVMRQWMDNVEAYLARASADPTLEIGCDIPFWLDKNPIPGNPQLTITEWLIAKHDHVAVMAYRDKAEGSNSISALVPQELGWADELGKKVLIAVETKQSNEGDFITFYEEGATYMNEELAKLPGLLAQHPSFAGIAIHSYEYWKTLKKE